MITQPRTAGRRAIALALPFAVLAVAVLLDSPSAYGQATLNGEIQGRAAPVFRRVCVGGPNAGTLCNADADCAPSTCKDRNVYNLQVAVHFDATPAELTDIQNMISAGSTVLFDVTDGQAEIGEAFIHNNAFGTLDADLRIYDQVCSSGTNQGNPCNVNNDCPPNTFPASRCGVWWGANTGNWQTGGSIHVSIDVIQAETAPGESLAHEFVHLVFDARDEYETGCGTPTTNDFDCPELATQAAGEASCLMDMGGTGAADGPFTELCWGQGDPSDPTDLTGGNHDADNDTEQSRCRSNRSCWDQVVWSWPDVFTMPAAAPDPAAGGAVVSPARFVVTDDAVRVVLVLDESGSMGLETPSRMSRLKVAAKDFIALAENGAEVGIVSYSDDAEQTSGRVNLAISPLVANRTPWDNAINGLSPDAYTNIGAGLDKAQSMITTAGGVTANTFVVLMTDGLNNRPSPQATADADLTTKIGNLSTAGIPVYVTCTGGDLTLQSQCSEIASGTGGFYVDSADAAQLPVAFVDFQERISGREAIDSAQGELAKGGSKTFWVDDGSESITFTLVWENPLAAGDMAIIDPDGARHESLPMPQGRWARFDNPKSGDWQAIVPGSDQSEAAAPATTGDEALAVTHVEGEVGEQVVTVGQGPYTLSAYIQNRVSNIAAGTRFASVLPGEKIWLYAHPRSLGGPISAPEVLTALVTLPDGSTDTMELSDLGRAESNDVDDVEDDGIFSGIYENTSQKGAYTFLLSADIEGWKSSGDRPELDPNVSSPRFERAVRISAAVGDPNDVETRPEDEIAQERQGRWGCWVLVIAILLLLIIVYLIWKKMSGSP